MTIPIVTSAEVFVNDPLPHLSRDKGFGLTLPGGTVAQLIVDQTNYGIVVHMKTGRGDFEAVHLNLQPILEAVLARATAGTAALRSPMPSVLAPTVGALEKPRYAP